MAEHNTLTGSSLHEPKGIDSAATSDAGKVLTPSASTAGESELRNLEENEITNRTSYMTFGINDISTADESFLVVPFAGTLTKIWTTLHNAITGSNAELTVKINGSAVSPSTITVTASGSAAGDVDSLTPTASNTVASGDVVSVETNGGSSTASELEITLVFDR